MTIRFLRELPKDLLGSVQIFFDDLLPGDYTGSKGVYWPDLEWIGLSRGYRSSGSPHEIAKTFVHEVAHHLQNYLTDRDMDVLWKHYTKEMHADLKRRGTRRYKNFDEWWVFTIQEHAEKTTFRKMETAEIEDPFKRAVQKGVYGLNQIREWLTRFQLRAGGRDEALHVYRQIRKGKRINYGAKGAGGIQLRKELPGPIELPYEMLGGTLGRSSESSVHDEIANSTGEIR